MSQQTYETVVADARAWLTKTYPTYDDLPDKERRLLAMAYLCDQLKVREVGGNNRGPLVEIIQESAGISPGDSWCAATLTLASKIAGAIYPRRSNGYNPASVKSWRQWAKDHGKLVTTPTRGCIALHSSGDGVHGHIGAFVKLSGDGDAITIEGNTSSGDAGSQADGGGMFRRERDLSFWSWGFGDL
jgi:hypothetical protein